MHTHTIALATEWEILEDNDLTLLQVKFQSTHLLNLPKFHVESSIKRSHPHQLMCDTYGGLELVFDLLADFILFFRHCLSRRGMARLRLLE